MGLIAIAIGAFKEYVILNTLIIIHELGHFLTAKFLHIETDKIYIYPLGGISKYKMPLNTSIKIELLILIMGPILQNAAYFLLLKIFPNDGNLILLYHLSLLVFNLLPIYPLDGGRILNLLLNNFIPYKKSLKIVIKFSYFITLILFIIQNNITINILVMVLFLLIIIYKEDRRVDYTYNRFLLERFLYKYKFKNKIIIDNVNNFYRNRTHIIKENDKYYLEDEYLTKKYQKFL